MYLGEHLGSGNKKSLFKPYFLLLKRWVLSQSSRSHIYRCGIKL